jgi:hypothetical protein
MLRVSFNMLTASARSNAAAALIAFGLAYLIVSSIVPKLPVATAITLVALGASVTLCGHVQHRVWPPELLAAHLLAYGVLYALLVTAICDLASRAPATGISSVQYLDLGLSAIVMAYTTRLCLAALWRRSDSRFH